MTDNTSTATIQPSPQAPQARGDISPQTRNPGQEKALPYKSRHQSQQRANTTLSEDPGVTPRPGRENSHKPSPSQSVVGRVNRENPPQPNPAPPAPPRPTPKPPAGEEEGAAARRSHHGEEREGQSKDQAVTGRKSPSQTQPTEHPHCQQPPPRHVGTQGQGPARPIARQDHRRPQGNGAAVLTAPMVRIPTTHGNTTPRFHQQPQPKEQPGNQTANAGQHRYHAQAGIPGRPKPGLPGWVHRNGVEPPGVKAKLTDNQAVTIKFTNQNQQVNQLSEQ